MPQDDDRDWLAEVTEIPPGNHQAAEIPRVRQQSASLFDVDVFPVGGGDVVSGPLDFNPPDSLVGSLISNSLVFCPTRNSINAFA